MIILTVLIVIIVKLEIAILIIILTVIMKIIIIMAIKITITVIMKITIVLKLMKTVVQNHNPKTYVCSSYDNAHQKVKKTFLSPNIPAPSPTQQGCHTLSSTLSPKRAIVFRVRLQ